MSKIELIQANALAETPASPGIARHLAFKGEDFLVIRSRSEPKTVSGWHHHGDHDVYAYLVSGSARLESADRQSAVSLSPGDFAHVPAHTVHREINPSSNERNEFILFLRGEGSLVVNVDDPSKAWH